MTRNALVVGSIGINLANLLVAEGWSVHGLARRPAERSEIIPVRADLLDLENTRGRAGRPRHLPRVLLHLGARQDTEAKNWRVNGAMLRICSRR